VAEEQFSGNSACVEMARHEWACFVAGIQAGELHRDLLGAAQAGAPERAGW